MELEVITKEDTALTKIKGKLTAISFSESLRGTVKELCEKDIKTIILDMSELIYIDSTGVGELVSVYTTASNADINLFLYDVPKVVEEILETTNLLEVFTILDNAATEVAVFQ